MVGTPRKSARITLLSIITSVCLACASAPLSAPTSPTARPAHDTVGFSAERVAVGRTEGMG